MSEQKHTPGPWKSTAEEQQHDLGENFYILGGPDYACYIAEMLNADHFPCISEDEAENYEMEVKANACLIAAAPETAAERDRLRSLNAELVTEIQNSLIEHQSVLGFLHERAAEGESVRIWIEMTEHRIAGCQAAIAKATAPAQPIPANTKEQV